MSAVKGDIGFLDPSGRIFKCSPYFDHPQAKLLERREIVIERLCAESALTL
ncbi:MAG: hypothetical protein M5U25_09490 [Planctomycetota bacterium]|nr:hypothetical protein [Planctomycetota bacterium]